MMPSTRRHALTRMAAGFGSVGLAGLLVHDNPSHFAPKAKRIIYLVLVQSTNTRSNET